MRTFDGKVFHVIGRYAAEWRALREEARTARIVNALPAWIRKDIGWPEARRGRGTHRHRA